MTKRIVREKMLGIRMPSRLHSEVKILAAKRDTTMQALVLDLIRETVEKEL